MDRRRLEPIGNAQEVLGGIGRSTVYVLVQRGELDLVKIGARAFITRDSIDGYIDRISAKETTTVESC